MFNGNVGGKASEALNSIKSRLGFLDDDDAQYQDFDDFDEYDDFDNDGFNEDSDRDYEGYGADYDQEPSYGAYRPATPGLNRSLASASSPDLVTMRDVRANREQSRNREASASARSGGVNALFESTSSHLNNDSYPSHTNRRVSVVSPVTYNDVEQIARILEAGDVAVLNLKTCPLDLKQRVLDFSFGVACVLHAAVESPAEKVFVFCCGLALSHEEKKVLIRQGIV